MPTLACLNGEIMPVEEARVPVWDRGFLFGDSVYEVFRLYRGRMWLEADHFRRLVRSLDEVRIQGLDFDVLRQRIVRTIEAGGVLDGTVYIQVTRGVAPRGHLFPNPPVPPTELIIVRPYDDSATASHRRNGVAVVSRPDQRWGRCDIKSTNLLANVLAVEAAHEAGGFEAVLVDRDGRVTEATHSSLLWVREGTLLGTPEGPEILPGTSRGIVTRLAAQEGIPFQEETVGLDDLKGSDEVLLAGTTIEVMPVVEIDGRKVVDGRPGPVTRRLQAAFTAAVERWLGGQSERGA